MFNPAIGNQDCAKVQRQRQKLKFYATFSKQCSIKSQAQARTGIGQRVLWSQENVWTVAKNAVEKGWYMPTAIAKPRSVISAHCGLPVSMQAPACMACLTLS